MTEIEELRKRIAELEAWKAEAIRVFALLPRGAVDPYCWRCEMYPEHRPDCPVGKLVAPPTEAPR